MMQAKGKQKEGKRHIEREGGKTERRPLANSAVIASSHLKKGFEDEKLIHRSI